MNYRTASWKQKVDPAFPKFISVFLKQLEKNRIPSSEGYVYINDMQFKELESHNFPVIANLYEDYNPVDAIIEDENIIGDRNILVYLKEFAEGMKEGSDTKVHSACIKIASAMNEDSKKYYLKHYENIASQNELFGNYHEMNEEKRNEYMRDSAAYDLSIAYHAVIIASEKNSNILKEETLQAIHRTFFRVWNTISVLVHYKGLSDLYSEAKAGNDVSLFKLFQMDKTLFDHEWVRRRIRKAMYLGDRVFFKSLSKSIAVDPLKNRKTRIIEYLVLAYFWDCGLYRLTVPEIMYLFEEGGICMTYDDEIKFRKFYDRFKKIRPKMLDF